MTATMSIPPVHDGVISPYRHKWGHRTLHDLGDLYHFNLDLTDWASPGSHDPHRVVHMAVRLVVEAGLPYRPASWHLWRDHRVFVPFATIQHGVEAGGKQRRSVR